MPTDAKPLFRIDALHTKLAAFTLPTAIAGIRPKLELDGLAELKSRREDEGNRIARRLHPRRRD